MKSAIEQMVEWLKKRRAKVFVWNDNYVERQSVLRKAQELQAEEQAQKSTAPAGLWEELNDLYKKSLYHPGLCLNVMGAYDVKDLLDKYRPAPSSDEGSFKMLEPNSVEQAIELYRNNPIFNRLVDLRVQEILSPLSFIVTGKHVIPQNMIRTDKTCPGARVSAPAMALIAGIS